VKRMPERVFEGHTSRVYGVCVSADGQHVLTGSEDHTAKLWDAHSGEELMTFRGHNHTVYSVAMTSNSRWAVTAGSYDRNAKLWNVQTGEDVHTFRGHRDLVSFVTVTPDDQHVVTASFDKTVKLWDLHTGEEVRKFKGHKNWIWSVCVSPDNQFLATSSADKTAIVWNLSTGEKHRILKGGHSGWVLSVDIDDAFVVTAGDDKVAKLWDLETAQEIRTFTGHEHWVFCVKIFVKDSLVVTASRDRTAKLWNMHSGEQLRTISGHEKSVFCVAMTQNSRFLVTSSGDKTVKLWDLAKDKNGRSSANGNDAEGAPSRYESIPSFDSTHRPSLDGITIVQGKSVMIRSQRSAKDGALGSVQVLEAIEADDDIRGRISEVTTMLQKLKSSGLQHLQPHELSFALEDARDELESLRTRETLCSEHRDLQMYYKAVKTQLATTLSACMMVASGHVSDGDSSSMFATVLDSLADKVPGQGASFVASFLSTSASFAHDRRRRRHVRVVQELFEGCSQSVLRVADKVAAQLTEARSRQILERANSCCNRVRKQTGWKLFQFPKLGLTSHQGTIPAAERYFLPQAFFTHLVGAHDYIFNGETLTAPLWLARVDVGVCAEMAMSLESYHLDRLPPGHGRPSWQKAVAVTLVNAALTAAPVPPELEPTAVDDLDLMLPTPPALVQSRSTSVLRSGSAALPAAPSLRQSVSTSSVPNKRNADVKPAEGVAVAEVVAVNVAVEATCNAASPRIEGEDRLTKILQATERLAEKTKAQEREMQELRAASSKTSRDVERLKKTVDVDDVSVGSGGGGGGLVQIQQQAKSSSNRRAGTGPNATQENAQQIIRLQAEVESLRSIVQDMAIAVSDLEGGQEAMAQVFRRRKEPTPEEAAEQMRQRALLLRTNSYDLQ